MRFTNESWAALFALIFISRDLKEIKMVSILTKIMSGETHRIAQEKSFRYFIKQRRYDGKIPKKKT